MQMKRWQRWVRVKLRIQRRRGGLLLGDVSASFVVCVDTTVGATLGAAGGLPDRGGVLCGFDELKKRPLPPPGFCEKYE